MKCTQAAPSAASSSLLRWTLNFRLSLGMHAHMWQEPNVSYLLLVLFCFCYSCCWLRCFFYCWCYEYCCNWCGGCFCCCGVNAYFHSYANANTNLTQKGFESISSTLIQTCTMNCINTSARYDISDGKAELVPNRPLIALRNGMSFEKDSFTRLL
jgi:hypothetical protein